jgi:hypothetical protein
MRRRSRIVAIAGLLLAAVAVAAAEAQPPVARPQPPPPAPGSKAPATPAAPAKPGPTTAPAPTAPPTTVARPVQAPVAPAPAAVAAPPQPTAAEAPPAACRLGAPVLSGSQYLESYDAGMGQYYCLYGSTQSFADVVSYYRTVLKDKGELVFDAPATHTFEVGKFKETDVAFPPGVTVKDYTWNASPGYPNPKPGAAPAHFPTVIQIVPPPPAPSPAPPVRRD